MWLWNLEFSKFFVLIQYPWNGTFLRFFGPLLRQILFDLAKTLTIGILQEEKHSVWKILENFEFWLKRNTAKVYSFGPF